MSAFRFPSPITFLMLTACFVGCQKKLIPEMLLSDDPLIREEAVQRLTKLTPEKKEPLIMPLMDALHDEDSNVIARAVDSLKLIGPAVVPAAKEALHNQDAFVRICGAEILGFYSLQMHDLLPELITALNDKHPLVREEAVAALEKMGTPEAQNALKAAKSTSPKKRV